MAEYQQGSGGCPLRQWHVPTWVLGTDVRPAANQDGGPDNDHTTSPFFANYWCDDGYAPEPGSIAAQRAAGTLPSFRWATAARVTRATTDVAFYIIPYPTGQSMTTITPPRPFNSRQRGLAWAQPVCGPLLRAMQ